MNEQLKEYFINLSSKIDRVSEILETLLSSKTQEQQEIIDSLQASNDYLYMMLDVE